MIQTQYKNSAIDDLGIIYNWNISSNFDENGECLINFELPYSINCNPTIKIEQQNNCSIIDINHTSFKIKRKSKQVKEIKWLAIGY